MRHWSLADELAARSPEEVEADDAEMARMRFETMEADARRWQIECDRQQEQEREAAAREERRQRFANQRRTQARYELPFLRTSVAELLMIVRDRCLRNGRCGLVIGPAGSGKTRALQQMVFEGEQALAPEAYLVTVTGVTGNSMKAIFDDICPILGVQPARDIADTQRRLNKLEGGPVLFFDEAQNLTLRPIRELLAISEATGIIMVFCGNAEALQLVSSKQAAIQQISRRLPIREEIQCIQDSDADLIADHFRVVGDQARQICRTIGHVFHADGVAQVLTYARQQLSPGAPVQVDDIMDAIEMFPQFRRALVGPLEPSRPSRRSSLKAIERRSRPA